MFHILITVPPIQFDRTLINAYAFVYVYIHLCIYIYKTIYIYVYTIYTV